MSQQKLVLAIPGLGLSSVAFALWLGGGMRAVHSAQVYGGPTDGSTDWQGRVGVVETLGEASQPARGLEIEIVRRGAKSDHRFVGRTGQDGWLDVRLPPLPGVQGLDLVVVQADSRQVLARGRPELTRNRWQKATRRGFDLLQRQRLGLGLEGAVMATPFFSRLAVARCPGAPRPLWVQAVGGEFEPSLARSDGDSEWSVRRVSPQPDGEYSVLIRPIEHVVEFNWSCDRTDPAGRHSVHLPVVPGALFAQLDGDQIRIQSARGLPRAYYTWVTESERLESGAIALAPGLSGISGGFLPRPASLQGRYLVVSSSPDGRSPSTVGYPLDGQEQTFDAIDGFLLDGAADAQILEERRLGRVRRALLGYVAALFSLALVLFRALVVESDRQLLGAFELSGAEAPLTRALPRRPLFLGGAAVALGLSLILVWLAL